MNDIWAGSIGLEWTSDGKSKEELKAVLGFAFEPGPTTSATVASVDPVNKTITIGASNECL